MLIATSTFSMVIIAVILGHMLAIHSPAELTAWTNALQVTGSILAALAGLPYAAGKVTGGLGDIVAAIKKRGE
jgi:hypothetical protein